MVKPSAGESGMQLVFGQQSHASLELRRQHLQGEAGAAAFHRADVVDRLAERQPIPRRRPVVEQARHQRGDPVLPWRLLQGRLRPHGAVDRNGVADMLGQHQQAQAVRQHADLRQDDRRRRRQCRQGGRGPVRQGHGVVGWGAERLGSAEAAGGDGTARAAGRQDGGDRVLRVQQLLCQPVDIGDRHRGVGLSHVAGRVEAQGRQRTRPAPREAGDAVGLEGELGQFLSLGCLDQVR